MQMTQIIKDILANYSGFSPAIKAKLCSILMHGKLGGTGSMVILPVDQGFEHGPARSFAVNEEAYDPVYHHALAIEAGLNAYAAPLGMLELSADRFAGQIPTILKMNSANSLNPKSAYPDQAITSSVKDALRLGCAAVGFTIYPGSAVAQDMMEEVRALIEEAKACGIPSVVWSYPRGGDLSKEGETALDVCAYAAHIACLLGAHIVKVKLPSSYIEQSDAKKAYAGKDFSSLSSRVAHVKQACFNGKRLVVFSGGASKTLEELYVEIESIRDGGGNGSIIGRNTFQRPRADALKMLDYIASIYKSNVALTV